MWRARYLPSLIALFIYVLKPFYFCVTTKQIIRYDIYTSLGRYLSWTIKISLYVQFYATITIIVYNKYTQTFFNYSQTSIFSIK